jgi:hypothetical protein
MVVSLCSNHQMVDLDSSIIRDPAMAEELVNGDERE